MSVTVCLLHSDLNHFLDFLAASGSRELTSAANNSVLYLCLLNDPANRELIQNNTLLNTDALVAVHRIYPRYLAQIANPEQNSDPNEPLINAEPEYLWIQQLEVLIGLPEYLHAQIRRTSANWRAYSTYADFRKRGGV